MATSHRYDLHVHSNASEGKLPPREVVALAADRGLSGIALTDVGTVDGVAEAQAMAGMLGVRCIAGVELVCRDDDGTDVRLLGYFVQPSIAQQLGAERTLTVAEAIAAIHAAGGVAVYARPGVRTADAPQRIASIERAAILGLDGIEVDHPDHRDDALRSFGMLADRLGLVQTGGSDDRAQDLDGPRLGCRTVAERVIEQLESRARAYPA